MKRFLLGLAAIVSLVAFGADRTKSALQSEINSKLASGSVITAAELRSVTTDIIDSTYNKTDETRAAASHTHPSTDISGLGTAATRNVPASGNASASEVVLGNDTRLGGGSGTVTSVALSAPAEFSVSGSPVTASGTLGLTWQNASARKVFRGPNSGAAAPTFTDLVALDVSDATTAGRNMLTAADVAAQKALLGLPRYWSEKVFQQTWHFDENTAAPAGWSTSLSGTGAALTVLEGEQDAYGVMDASTGTTATGRTALFRGGTAMRFGGGEAVCRMRIKIPTLSDATDRYVMRLGWSDQVSADHTDGAYFEYDESVSPNWRIVTANNSTRTKTTTSAAVVAGTWELLEVRVNAAGTSVEYFLDGASIGTITTNIPTASGRASGIVMYIIKSVGTTSRSFRIDCVNFEFALP